MKKTILITVFFLFISLGSYAQEGFIGEVRLFAGNFAPRGWAFCDGQLLSISSNTALFSILGTIYGGDGRTTFGLPDLRGRTAVGPRRGPGLDEIRLGQKFGGQSVSGNSGESSHTSVSRSRTTPGLGLNYIICVQGIFPSRS
ncbi:MAG: phage tail protein [Flavobacterium sp.]|nr:MAG: phage tail protein [Flavobacterium sp.]